MKAAVITFPGSNRQQDVMRALHQATGTCPAAVWHGDQDLPQGTDLVVLPGGFSYGDYLRCGAIAGHATIMTAVRTHAERGGYVLGICNGFQILVESGLLPGILMRNAGLRFICKMQHLQVTTQNSDFTRLYQKGQVLKVCIAHGEGNYMADEHTIAALENDDRVAFRYCNADGSRTQGANPNGSINDIAGILSANRRVLGMMPHPENLIEDLMGGTDGRALFDSIAKAA